MTDYKQLHEDFPDSWLTEALRQSNHINKPDSLGNYLISIASAERELENINQALSLGANVNCLDVKLRSPLLLALEGPYLDFDSTNQSDLEEIIKILVAAGADVEVRTGIREKEGKTAFSIAQDLGLHNVLAILVPKGCSFSSMLKMHEATPPAVEQYANWCAAGIYGTANPSVMDNPVWEWLVRTRISAYWADKTHFQQCGFATNPGWCFDRYGRSVTTLPNGSVVFIAGEHEDHYDPDFFIYNDVIVQDREGRLQIYGYPKEIFPPTDFHSATLVGDCIILIGRLGYPADRLPGATPVYRLSLDTFAIQAIETKGEPPGWIHGHSATLSDDEQTIVLTGGEIDRDSDQTHHANMHDWALDVNTWTWKCKLHRSWMQWAFIRRDRKPNHLWDMRHAIWQRGVRWKYGLEASMQKMSQELGFSPNLDLIASLYRPDHLITETLKPDDDEYNVFRTSVESVTVRGVEDRFSLRVVVEGQLSEATLTSLQTHILQVLEQLEGVAWEIETT